ncbi:hypothetical protein [Finegoldia magna]|uniref:hypothetical protein n=2 Tax=Finegoldia magna TaxID=1260 RepID=UPI002915F50F|nr:hypothetical protein [Finegoldia magna]
MKWQMRFLNCKIDPVKHVYRTGRVFKNLKEIFIASIIILLVAIYWAFDKNIRKLPAINNLNEAFKEK